MADKTGRSVDRVHPPKLRHRHLGRRLKNCVHKTRHVGRRDQVIAIDAEDVIPSCAVYPVVACLGDPPVRFVKDHDTVVTTSKLVHKSPTSVRRTIVDEQDLQIAVRLSEHALDARHDEILDVVHRDHDGHDHRLCT